MDVFPKKCVSPHPPHIKSYPVRKAKNNEEKRRRTLAGGVYRQPCVKMSQKEVKSVVLRGIIVVQFLYGIYPKLFSQPIGSIPEWKRQTL